MSYSHILLEVDEAGIALVTVNRPDKLNALSGAVVVELKSAFESIAADPRIRAAIVTGAGEKAFVAGADIQELAVAGAMAAKDLARRGQSVFRKIETLRKPVIAAVNGFALGGGLELAMACAIRIASGNAKMGQPEVKLGIPAGYGGTQRLPKLVGRGRALEMLLTGDPIDAQEAWRIGLVNHVTEQAELLAAAHELMRRILANGPLACALTLEAVDVGLNSGLEEGLRFEAAAFGLAAATDDKREGTAAFLEKRKPRFTGR